MKERNRVPFFNETPCIVARLPLAVMMLLTGVFCRCSRGGRWSDSGGTGAAGRPVWLTHQFTCYHTQRQSVTSTVYFHGGCWHSAGTEASLPRGPRRNSNIIGRITVTVLGVVHANQFRQTTGSVDWTSGSICSHALVWYISASGQRKRKRSADELMRVAFNDTFITAELSAPYKPTSKCCNSHKSKGGYL